LDLDAAARGGQMVTGLVVSVVWIGLVLIVAGFIYRRRTSIHSVRLRLFALQPFAGGLGSSNAEPSATDPITRLGIRLLRFVPASKRDYVTPRILGGFAVFATVLVPVSPVRATTLVIFAGLGVLARTKRQRITRERELRQELPALVDLLGVALQSGRTLLHAIELVCRDHPGELHRQLLVTAQSVDTGGRFIDSLQALADSDQRNEHLSSLIGTLVSAERYGIALPLALHELARDVRDIRRRQGEAEARRVPIRMLGPLVLLLLPSFALLTVAPLLASGLSSLRLNS
jgi:Flp pilus assembly protein TadB